MIIFFWLKLYIVSFSFRFNGNYDYGLYLFCPEPLMKPKFLNIISSFPPEIWIILLVTLVAVTLVTAVLQRIQNLVTDDPSHQSSFFRLFGIFFAECRYGTSSIIFIMSLYIEFILNSPVNGPLKYHVLGWTVFTFVFTLAYSCNLRANLVKADYEDPIDSLSQESSYVICQKYVYNSLYCLVFSGHIGFYLCNSQSLILYVGITYIDIQY